MTFSTHFVSWDGVTFSAVHSYGTTSQMGGSGSKRDMAFNNGVYCSNRHYSGTNVQSYFLDAWVSYALDYASLLLTSLTGNFCSFYSSSVANTYVIKSPDGQAWTTTTPTLPAEIEGGAFGFPQKVGLRVYWVNYTFHGTAGSTYDYIIGTADGSTFSMVTGLDPETMNAVGSPSMTATEGNLGYALASKMG